MRIEEEEREEEEIYGGEKKRWNKTSVKNYNWKRKKRDKGRKRSNGESGQDKT